jgi:hypothetical protein
MKRWRPGGSAGCSGHYWLLGALLVARGTAGCSGAADWWLGGSGLVARSRCWRAWWEPVLGAAVVRAGQAVRLNSRLPWEAGSKPQPHGRCRPAHAAWLPRSRCLTLLRPAHVGRHDTGSGAIADARGVLMGSYAWWCVLTDPLCSGHKAWMPRPCSNSDMNAASTSYKSRRTRTRWDPCELRGG